jgi:hypothetical protein
VQQNLDSIIRVPTLQEQDKDLPDPHSIRCEAALPRIGIYEHRGENVHQAIGYFCSLREVRGVRSWDRKEAGTGGLIFLAYIRRSGWSKSACDKRCGLCIIGYVCQGEANESEIAKYLGNAHSKCAPCIISRFLYRENYDNAG